MTKGFVTIRNQTDSNVLELYFLDVIADSYDWWSDTVYSKIQEIIDKVNWYKPVSIKVIIDSVGGDAQVGLAIYNYLRACGKTVEVEIIGLAGSIASVVAMAATKGKLRIARNAFMMIHKACGYTAGTADEIRQSAALVDKYDDQIADVYAQRTGKTAEAIKALYATSDYWMTGDEAVAQGFADATFNDTPNLQVAARLQGSDYKNIPAHIRAQMENKGDAEDLRTILNNQFTDMKKFFTDIVNGIRGVKPAEGAAAGTITNQIADAIQTPFEKLGDEMESQITNQVAAAVKGDEVTRVINEAVTTAITAATAPLTKKIEDLEKAKTDLETEVTNLKGGASNSGKEDEGKPSVKGKWS